MLAVWEGNSLQKSLRTLYYLGPIMTGSYVSDDFLRPASWHCIGIYLCGIPMSEGDAKVFWHVHPVVIVL